MYLDALMIKVRDGGIVGNKAAYLALGINPEGQKEVLGRWLQQTEGAKFWLTVANELKQIAASKTSSSRAATDSKASPRPSRRSSRAPSFLQTMHRAHDPKLGARFVAWAQRKALCRDLRRVYGAPTEAAALVALGELEAAWGKSHPAVISSWRNNWERVRPFFAFPHEVRRIIYTTNARSNRSTTACARSSSPKRHFPNDDAATKLLFLALRNAEKKWLKAPHSWKSALNQFSIHFEGRLPT